MYAQGKRRILATDEWLRVKGCENVYAIGDCATIDQRKIMVCEVVKLVFFSCYIGFFLDLPQQLIKLGRDNANFLPSTRFLLPAT